MKPGLVCGVFWLALPVFGQYGGPAILSRGEAPAAMVAPQVSFRPYVEVVGIYDTGLAAVAVNQRGDLANASAPGVMTAWGVSGAHSWRHTQVGLNYRGSLRHYDKHTYYDSTDQSLLLGVTHQPSRHTILSVRENLGIYSRDYGAATLLSQTVPFDPSVSAVPKSDFFDNRTVFLSTQADFVWQRSVRMSLNLGGDSFLTRRRSAALAGVVGNTARSDLQYRLTRRTTVGGNYSFSHYSYSRSLGGSDIHAFSGAYAIRFSKTVEFSGFGGFARLESKFRKSVALDPVIAALLGVSSAVQIAHEIVYIPTVAARFSKTMPRGVIWVNGGRSLSQGNGLFLTSESSSVQVGYTYTGLRRWSFAASTGYNQNNSRGNIRGDYTNTSASISASRQLRSSTHLIAGVDVRNYTSDDYSRYNRLIYTLRLGIGFTPGDVPLRIW